MISESFTSGTTGPAASANRALEVTAEAITRLARFFIVYNPKLRRVETVVAIVGVAVESVRQIEVRVTSQPGDFRSAPLVAPLDDFCLGRVRTKEYLIAHGNSEIW